MPSLLLLLRRSRLAEGDVPFSGESNSVTDSNICEGAHLCNANVQAANDALNDVERLALDGHSVRDVWGTRFGAFIK